MDEIAEKSNFISNLSSFLSSDDKNLLTQLERFIHDYKRTREITQIPISLFSGKLAASEVIVKYLKEKGLSYAEISKIIKRDQRTVWVTYSKAIKKQKQPFPAMNNELLVDVSIFSTRKPPLHSLILHLTERGYSLKQIASMLNRSYKNIWMIKNEKKGTI